MNNLTKWTIEQWVSNIGWFTRRGDPLEATPYLYDGPPALLFRLKDDKPFDLLTFGDGPTYRLPLDLSDIEGGTIKIGRDWYGLDARVIAIDLKDCEQVQK